MVKMDKIDWIVLAFMGLGLGVVLAVSFVG